VVAGDFKKKNQDLRHDTLTHLKTHVPIKFTNHIEDFRTRLDLAKVGELFRDLEFRTMMTRLKKVLNIKETEQETLFADDSSVDPRELEQAKLGVYVLNPVISEPSLDDVLRYGETFAQAYEEIQKDITEQNLDFVWKEIEVACIDAVRTMNEQGFTIDQKQLSKLSKKFHKRIDTLEQSIHSYAGEVFNIKSTQQLSREIGRAHV